MQNYLRAQAKLETAWKQVSNQCLVVGIISHVWFSLLSTKNIFFMATLSNHIYIRIWNPDLGQPWSQRQLCFNGDFIGFCQIIVLASFCLKLGLSGRESTITVALVLFPRVPLASEIHSFKKTFFRIFVLGEIVWPSSLALFIKFFIRIFVQGNCSTQLSGGSLAQLVIVRGLAALDSTCARFSFCSFCKRAGPS